VGTISVFSNATDENRCSSNQLPKASETFIASQITGLIDQGHTVDIFACYGSEDRMEDAHLRKYELLDRTRYLTTPTSRKERAMTAVEATLKRCWKKTAAFHGINQPVPDGEAANQSRNALPASFSARAIGL
jgi:hypothetical protein